MEQTHFDGIVFRSALSQAMVDLFAKRESLNRINTFPVPDGDTGNNMLTTIEFALHSVEGTCSNRLDDVTKAAYQGAREGSTGNSGAIFAQYLKGWTSAFHSYDQADALLFTQALRKGAEYAYAAVQNPKEGTILTVAREAAEAAEKAFITEEKPSLHRIMVEFYLQSRKSLIKTNRMLPELRAMHFIDAGGWGLFIFFEAILHAMEIQTGKTDFNYKARQRFYEAQQIHQFDYPYDLEFVVLADERNANAIRTLVGPLGSELIIQTNGDNSHVHIHTDNPLKVVEAVSTVASFTDMTIRNMRSQYESLVNDPALNNRFNTVAFGKSPGFLAMFAMAGAQLAIHTDNLTKKKRILNEYCTQNALLLSSTYIEIEFIHENVVELDDEVNILASLVVVYSCDRPSQEIIRKAANYPRIAYVVDSKSHGMSKSLPKLHQKLRETISSLQPRKSEILSIYYANAHQITNLQAVAPRLQQSFPQLDAVELYFGGQTKAALVVSLE